MYFKHFETISWNQSGMYEYELSVGPVNESDYGEYTATVSNGIGAPLTVTFYVKGEMLVVIISV